MRRICVVTSSRSEYARVRSVLHWLDRCADVSVDIVACGSHLDEQHGYTLDEIKKEHSVSWAISPLPTHNPYWMAKSVGHLTSSLADAFQSLKPDIVLALTDRFETLAAAQAAALMNIHVAHLGAGEVSGTIDESIRHAVTKLSHVHFCSNDLGRARVIQMGEPESQVFNTGDPGVDAVMQVKPGQPLDRPFLLVLHHPVTTEYGQYTGQIQDVLAAVDLLKLPVVLILPNHDPGIATAQNAVSHYVKARPGWSLHRTLAHEDFLAFMRDAACMIGNSSAGIREAGYFGTPVVNIGSRQQGRERSRNVIDADYVINTIVNLIQIQLNQGYEPEYIYGDGHAGEKIAELLATTDLGPLQKGFRSRVTAGAL